MGNILSFTLGLENAEFIEKLGLSEKLVVGFEAVAEGLHKVFEKTWEAIEKGAALQGLRNRTGVAVDKLYEMQQAFSAVGVGADSVGPMLVKTQKFMGGITDEGESADTILHAIGLSFTNLKKADTAKVFGDIAVALNKIDPNQAAAIAAKLYGREGAGNMLQISRAAHEFNMAMKESTADADVWKKSAPYFERIEAAAKMIRGHLETMWAGIAMGAEPAIQKIENLLKKINFGEIGKQIGSVIDSIANAFEQGRISELLSLALQSGIQEGTNFLLASMAGWSAAMEDVFTHTFKKVAVNMSWELAKGLLQVQQMLSNPMSFVQGTLALRAAAHAPMPTGNLLEDFAKGYGAVYKNLPHDKAADLAAALQSLHSKTLPAIAEGDKPVTANLSDEKHDKPKYTALEQIGYVIGRGGFGGNRMEQVAASTAVNTAKTVELLHGLPARIAQSVTSGPSHANLE